MEYVYVVLMKVKEDDEVAFPINGIKNIEKVPFKRAFNEENSDEIRIKVSFIDDLKWNDIYIWFFSEKTYLGFLEFFLENSVKKKTKSISK